MVVVVVSDEDGSTASRRSMARSLKKRRDLDLGGCSGGDGLDRCLKV